MTRSINVEAIVISLCAAPFVTFPVSVASPVSVLNVLWTSNWPRFFVLGESRKVETDLLTLVENNRGGLWIKISRKV